MEKCDSEWKFESKRLADTVALAEVQLEQARRRNEENESAILEAKQEMRDSAPHSVGSLWSSDGFEALAAISQYANPVTAKIDQYETTERQIVQLENLIQSPYFARVDFKFADDETFENVYIGRSSLMEEDTYEMHVYDWRSPIASLFYRFQLGSAFYEAPMGRISGEISLKRQYEIKKSKLEYFFDADVQIVDEFLRKLLSQNTSSKMKAIVETIQKEQDLIIRDMDNELMMVQGVAGSGKTSIALHRAAYLMYQGLAEKLSAGNIMIISPNAVFEQYISKVLPELGEENVVTAVFEEILMKVLRRKHVQPRNRLLENLLTNSRFRNVIKDSIKFKTSHPFMEILDRFIIDIPKKWIRFSDVYYEGKCIVSKEELKDKVLTLAGRKNATLSWALEYLQEYVTELIREMWGEKVNRRELARIRDEIQEFTRLDVQFLYRRLLTDKEYFLRLAEDTVLPGNLDKILKYTNENLNSGYLYYDDATAQAYLYLKLHDFSAYKNIKQVVIDEAQDYYPLQYEIFKLLFKGAKYTVLGDINQTLEKKEDLTLYEQIGRILDKKKASLVTMDKSFRCTNEILNFGAKFLDQSLEVKSFNREGDEPQIFIAEDPDALCDLIAAEVNTCLEKGYGSIGLICKSERNACALFAELKDKINVKLIKNEGNADLEGVFIIPVYMSKGLEFDAVLICDADAGNYHSHGDKKLLYVASTRALHRLNLFCKGEVSPLV